MAPEQNNGSFDYLNTLNVQQLRGILHSELDEDEVNVELIKKINAVLASKTEEPELDVDSAYNRLRAAEGSEPLYSEVMDEMAAEPEPEKGTRPRPRFRSLFRVGLVAAVIIVLFIGTGIVGYAMGFDFWGAMRDWTEDRFSFLVGDSLYKRAEGEDPYSKLREEFQTNGVTVEVVPEYMPDGFSLSSVVTDERLRGLGIFCTLSNTDKEILLNYTLATKESNSFYAKDEADPEVYTVCGIDHNIFTNEGKYIAVWMNQNIQCEIQGVEDKEELLKMIDSIYKER